MEVKRTLLNQAPFLLSNSPPPRPHGKNAEDILLRIEMGKTSPSDGINSRREEEKGEEELAARESDAVEPNSPYCVN